VNLEYVPLFPATVVRAVLDDPRKIPYLLVWKSERDGEIKEAIRVISLGPTPYLTHANSIEVKRTDGSVSHIRAIKWSLPRNGGYTICWLARCGMRCTDGKQQEPTPPALKLAPGSAEGALG
jgi:hypothetical protein